MLSPHCGTAGPSVTFTRRSHAASRIHRICDVTWLGAHGAPWNVENLDIKYKEAVFAHQDDEKQRIDGWKMGPSVRHYCEASNFPKGERNSSTRHRGKVTLGRGPRPSHRGHLAACVRCAPCPARSASAPCPESRPLPGVQPPARSPAS